MKFDKLNKILKDKNVAKGILKKSWYKIIKEGID